MIGFKNDLITVVSFLGKDKYRKHLWSCICKCGKSIVRTTNQINSGNPKSCGCYKQNRRGNTSNHPIKHGLANKHPLYKTWKNIKSRCYNKNNPDYKIYGGKNVLVCSEWINDFKSFYDWSINNGWKKNLCIDRKDPSKNYSPDNCQYITMSANSKKVYKDNPNLHKGTNNASVTINEDIVKKIRKLYLEKVSQKTIMSMFNISRNIVYQVVHNKTWKHVK